jgi:hemerythrin superfamily protein
MAMQTTNPVEMLKADHQKVKGLFSQFEAAGEDQKPDIFKEIVKELQVHTKIEEEIFYPAVKKLDSELAVEAEEEHNIVDWIISQMKKLKPDDEHYEAKFTTLKENVEHHIEEEEKEMFPEAQEKLGSQMESLGQKMMERKEALMKRGSSSSSSRSRSASSSRSRSRSTSRSK